MKNANELLDGLTTTLEFLSKSGYRDGLQKAIEIIDRELQFAIKANPQMAMGMSQIKMLIEKEVNHGQHSSKV